MSHSLRMWQSLLACAVVSAAVPVCAQRTAMTGRLLGLVTDAAGHPEANAVVEARRDGLHSQPVIGRTDEEGTFSIKGLAPGTYYVEIGKGAKIATRRKVSIQANQRAVLVVSLPALLQSVRFGAPEGGPTGTDHEFRWVLREAASSRPVLRFGASPVTSESVSDRALTGYVSLLAGGGSRAFDSAGNLATSFQVQTSLWAGTNMALSGDIGMNGGLGNSRIEADFRPSNAASQQNFLVSVRQLGASSIGNLPTLRVVSLNYSNGADIGDRIHLQYGAMLNTVTMANSFHTFDPYARVTYRLSANSEIEYRFASAVPPVQFGADGAQMADPTPQVTMSDFRPRLERANHQELQYSDSLTPNDLVEAALFSDHYSGAVVNGLLPTAAPGLLASGNLLPDLYSRMFAASGGTYGGDGFRVGYLHRFSNAFSLAVGFTSGVVLAPDGAALQQNRLSTALSDVRRDAWTVRAVATTPGTHTRLVCSYRSLNGPSATGLDLYDNSFARSDSFANLTIRQPLPKFFNGNGRKVEALLEFRNLLAQGYIPVLSQDGHTLYLIQSARSFRGGFSINF